MRAFPSIQCAVYVLVSVHITFSAYLHTGEPNLSSKWEKTQSISRIASPQSLGSLQTKETLNVTDTTFLSTTVIGVLKSDVKQVAFLGVETGIRTTSDPKDGEQDGDELGDPDGDSLGTGLGTEVGDTLGSEVGSTLGVEVGEPVGGLGGVFFGTSTHGSQLRL